MSFSSSLDFMLMWMLELIFISGNYCFSFVFVEHDMFFASNGNWEKSEPPMGLELTALLDLVRCSNYWATGHSMESKGEMGVFH